MSQIVIVDTSCLIVLQKIQMLEVLREMFGTIFITEEVAAEYAEALPEWIEVKRVQDQQKKRLLGLNLDAGEASVIALCMEEPKESLLVIDERKGRRIAMELGLKTVGTLGVVVKAKERGIIQLVQPIVERLEKAGFRMSPMLKAEILGTEK
jgi:predicted nucleic acid-binding protein